MVYRILKLKLEDLEFCQDGGEVIEKIMLNQKLVFVGYY